jgi:regulator of sirC expression with transglutaminase-like and TPR domain
MVSQPKYCRQVAYDRFQAQLADLDRTDTLVTAAVAISQHAMFDASAEDVHARIEQLADKVRSKVQTSEPTAVLANLHQLLFDELKFQGDSTNYYHARNSYLPYVLESRRGIPITLTLVYKAVAERLRLEVNGLNCPAHFLAEVIAGNDRMIIDPFRGGTMLTRAEARSYIEQLIRQRIPESAEMFPVASHQAWLARILRNLQNVFSMQQNERDMKAMWELEQLLTQS